MEIPKDLYDEYIRLARNFYNMRNVEGISIGYYDGEPAIYLFTSLSAVPFSTKHNVVLINEKFRSFELPSLLTQKFRPVVSGVSVSSLYGNTGTIGPIVDGKIVSCSHVLVRNPFSKTQNDLRVTQPGYIDGGDEDDVIGYTVEYSLLKDGTVADFAVAKPIVPVKNSCFGVGRIKGFRNPYVGSHVVKVGRTTGYTRGTIVGSNGIFRVRYMSYGRTIVLRNQFLVEGDKFALPGDSGASVISRNRVVGIVVAGGKRFTLCTPINTILRFIKGGG